MKTFGYIALTLGCLSLVGSLMAHSTGNNGVTILGPIFWCVLGIIFIAIANAKKKKKE